MPLQKCSANGKEGWRWGSSGKCYTGPGGKKAAIKQGLAIGGGTLEHATEVDMHLLGFTSVGELDGQNVSRIDVMPAGEFVHRQAGKMNVTENELEQLALDINERANRIPVDFDHSFAYGRGSLAAGWFLPGTAKVEGDKLRADVEWTSEAATDIRSGKYRYLSPEWHQGSRKNSQGKAVGRWQLMAAALTNRPFFDNMQPVTLADQGLGDLLNPSAFLLTAEEQEGLIESLGSDIYEALYEAASGPDPVARERARKALLDGAQRLTKENEMPDLTALAESVGLAEDSSDEEILTAVAEKLGTAAETEQQKTELEAKVAELEAKVPPDEAMKALIASAAKGEDAAKRLNEMERDTFLADAVRERLIDPAQKEHFAGLYDVDPEGVKALVGSMTPRPLGAIGSDGGGSSRGSSSPRSETIQGSEYPVDEQTSQIHDKAIEILEAAGKTEYTPDEYVAAAGRAADELTGI